MKTVLIAGASGVVGQAALAYFAAQGDCTVIALSRRRPDVADDVAFTHLPVDLTDAQACAAALATTPAPTHVVFAALHEKADLVAGWRDAEQMTTNERMLGNLLAPVVRRGALQHVTLLQGTKAYGVHLHRIAVPARERWPRDAHANFYWLQEDLLRETAAREKFTFTIFRPQIIFGDAVGVAMNLIPVLGVYGALCRAQKRPFAFPGGADYLLEAIDADLLARAIHWAGETLAAAGETFNITNGDVFVWRNVWPAIAAALGVETGPDRPMSLAHHLAGEGAAWDAIVARHGLRPVPLRQMLEQSDTYADFCFAHGARAPSPVLVSTIKLRQAGFGECCDTEDMFHRRFDAMRAKRLLPPL